MSNEAMTWAMEEAPVPTTAAGKPNTPAAGVLKSLAYHADKNGANSWPSIERIQLEARIGGASTVRAALSDLENAGLITRDGSAVSGNTKWRLNMSLKRSTRLVDELAAMTVQRRLTDRQRQDRRRDVTPVPGVTSDQQNPTIRDPVTPVPGVTSDQQNPTIRDPVTPGTGVTDEIVTPVPGVSHAGSRRDVTPVPGVTYKREHPGEPSEAVPGARCPGPLRNDPPQAPGRNGKPVPDSLTGSAANSSPEGDPPPAPAPRAAKAPKPRAVAARTGRRRKRGRAGGKSPPARAHARTRSPHPWRPP